MRRYQTKDTDLASLLKANAERFRYTGCQVELRGGREIVIYSFEIPEDVDMSEFANDFHNRKLLVEPKKLLQGRQEIHLQLREALRKKSA